MQVDPAVSRCKFGRELERLRAHQSTLEARGIIILGSTAYPILELLFVPRHHLQAVVPASQAGSIFLPRGSMVSVDFPNLAARAFKARFDLTDYDLRAPSLEFRDPWSDAALEYQAMFRALEFEQQRKAHLVLLEDHPNTRKPFLCLRGIREYHEHPQHSGDEWLLYRDTMSVFSIVMSLWRVSLDLVHPRMVIAPNGVQVQWAAEEKS